MSKVTCIDSGDLYNLSCGHIISDFDVEGPPTLGDEVECAVCVEIRVTDETGWRRGYYQGYDDMRDKNTRTLDELLKAARVQMLESAVKAIQKHQEESKVYPDEDFSLGCARGLVHAKTCLTELIKAEPE